jgi:hypothetical protein
MKTMTEPAVPPAVTTQKLREVFEGQVLRLADTSFAVLARHRRHHLIHLDLEADDGSHSTLIGIPGALVRLRETATPAQQ